MALGNEDHPFATRSVLDDPQYGGSGYGGSSSGSGMASSPSGSPEFFQLFNKFGSSLDGGDTQGLALQEVCGTFSGLSEDQVKEFEQGRGEAYRKVKQYVPSAFNVRSLCTSLASFQNDGTGNSPFGVLENAGYAGFSTLLNAGIRQANKSGIPYLSRLEFEGGFLRGAAQFSATTVQPLYQDDINHHYIFNQLSWYRQSTETDDGDADDTLNAGLAYRRLLRNETLMVGGNVFFDHQTDQNHNRMSIGVDAQTSLYGIAVNRYVPLTKWKTVDDLYESRALGGWDVEVSGKHPDYPNWTGYVRGYTWKRYDDLSDIYGVGANLEWNPIPVMVAGVGFTSENETNTDLQGFVRMRFRFDQPLAEQWKARKGLTSVKDRIFDKVRRENVIRTQKRERAVQSIGNVVLFSQGSNSLTTSSGVIPLTAGARFNVPATAQTSNNAGDYARLQLTDGGTLTIGQGSEVVMESGLLRLVQGTMHYISGTQNILVNVPGGTITLLGTDIDVVTNGTDSSVRVRDGAIQLAGAVSGSLQVIKDAMGRFVAGVVQTITYKSPDYVTHADRISLQIDRISAPIVGAKVAPYNTGAVVLSKDATAVGDTLQLAVSFNDIVRVTGVPSLAMTINGTARDAAYLAGDGTKQLLFQYVLPSTEAGATTILITGLDLSGPAAIRDNSGKEAVTVFAQDMVTRQPIAPSGHTVTFNTDPVNATNANNISFTIANGASGDTYSYTITDSSNNTVTNSGNITSTSQTISGVDVSTLNDGNLTISVVVTDSFGNASPAVTDTVEKRTTLPSGYTVSFTTSPIDTTNVTNAGFEIANATAGYTYSYTITDANNDTVTATGTIANATETITGIDLSSLADGTLTISVTLTDTYGNVGAATTNTVTKSLGPPPTAFVATWNTSNTSGGSSANNQIRLPLEAGGTYNFMVNWGDGTTSTITSGTQPEITHTYATPGTYTIALDGTIRGFRFADAGDHEKILDISQWGNINFGNGGAYFAGAGNLTASATDAPDLTGTTTFWRMFANANAFNGAIGNWSVSNITDMSGMFTNATAFNQTLDSWDVGSVTNMQDMFAGATTFNQAINSWDVSNVTNMRGVFYLGSAFNQPLNNWDVSSATTMIGMFQGAIAFNQPLDSWDVSNVTVINNLFEGATAFNQPLNNWNVSNVVDMGRMFYNASVFNQPLDNWDVGNVTTMQSMFSGATALSQANYATTLNGWTQAAKLPLQNNVTLDAGGKYSAATNPGRQTLLQSYSWTINDGGPTGPAPTAFVATWNTNNTSSGSSSANQVRLPLEASGTYNFVVNWGDGTSSTITSGTQPEITHTYATAGTYTIALDGAIRGFRFAGSGDRLKILNVSQWGNINFGNNGGYFNNAANLTASATDAPSLTGTTNLAVAFQGASSFNGAIGNWDVSNVTTMHGLFEGATSFNQPLNNWDVSNVTVMRSVFNGATSFNQPLDNWDVSNVTNMEQMFQQANAFNQPLNSWDVSSVTTMRIMFEGNTAFNQPLDAWNVGNVTNMNAMFQGSVLFNQSLANWDVGNVTTMQSMFSGATAFSQANYALTLNGWTQAAKLPLQNNVRLDAPAKYSAATNPGRQTLLQSYSWTINDGGPTGPAPTAFVATWNTNNTSGGSSGANQVRLPLEASGTYNFVVNWGDGTSSTITSGTQPEITHTYATAGTYTIALDGAIRGFRFAGSGDRLKLLNISQWGNINFGNNGGYFQGTGNMTASATDTPDLTGTTSFVAMFQNASSFNGALNSWDVSNVTDMSYMFRNAVSFNQPLNSWNTSNLTVMNYMFQTATAFNQPIGNWDTGNVTQMLGVFDTASAFNRPIETWNVSNVTNMTYMFLNASAFNQSLAAWDVGNVATMATMFNNASSFSQANYAATLNGWTQAAKLPLQNTVTLDAPGKYSAATNPGRNTLLRNYNWTINDGGPAAPSPTAFTATWNTSNTSGGSSANNQVRLPLVPGGTYNFVAHWGDGTTDTITSWNQAEATHTYATPGTYTVALDGTVRGFRFANGGDLLKILNVSRWGNVNFGNDGAYFWGASNLTATATDAPDLAGTTQLWFMFSGASAFNGAIGNWDVSDAVNMQGMFSTAASFNQPLNNWDVSNVTDMSSMFLNATSFNQPLNNWDVSNVVSTASMFRNASAFNGALGDWETNSLTDMTWMFMSASAFNQPIGDWDVSRITNMNQLFVGASSFNQPLNNWDVSNVTNMDVMFSNAAAFNQPLNNWNVGNVTSMDSMFMSAAAFNQSIDNWDVSKVTSIASMFRNATAFDQPLNGWNVSNVTTMYLTFFGASSFNQPLSNWDVGNVTDMRQTFSGASAFTQANYAASLNGWTQPAKLPVQNGVTLDAPTRYSPAANPGRATLLNDFSWTINDGGPPPPPLTAFVATWNTANVSTGSSANNQVRLPLESVGTYNFTVDWGDGTTNTITSWNQAEATHTYAASGTYTVALNGTIRGFRFANNGDRLKILDVSQWGNINFGNRSNYFYGASNLTASAMDKPDLTGVTTFIGMFREAVSFNSNINNWDTSNVTNMSFMFYGARAFDQPLNNWNMSNVTNTASMFTGAQIFNQPLNNWNVSNVTDMSGMFNGAYAFNQSLNTWDVSNVTNMYNMFFNARAFSQPVDSWNVAKVTTMNGMFSGALAFNQPLNSWNVSNVTDMNSMFNTTHAFNQPLNNWNVTKVTDMGSMFRGAQVFNQPLNSWNVNQVTTMQNFLTNAAAFSQANYATTLNGWTEAAKLPLQNSVTLDAPTRYSAAAHSGRSTLINNYSWTVNDGGPAAPAATAFVATWNTANVSTGSSANNQVRLPLEASGTYNFTVDWGDGTTNTITSWNQAEATHTYATPGTYTVALDGSLRGFRFNNTGDRLKILNISRWGNISYGNSGGYFYGAANLTASATDAPNLTGMTNMGAMFQNAALFNGNISNWNVSNATAMNGMFSGAASFNQPLNSWNVSNVTNMFNMFQDAAKFNQPLNNWDVSKVTGMPYMFNRATEFNGNISNWNVGNVTDMQLMFSRASAFNQSLNSWNVSKVTNMRYMLELTLAFNQPLDNWSVGNVTVMNGMFAGAAVFNQPINNWNVGKVTNMSNMFQDAAKFNQPLNSWDVSKVTNTSYMFNRATEFNGNISAWNVANVTDMQFMFNRASAFNQPLNSWNVSKVTSMRFMLEVASAFNQPLNNWTLSSVTTMEGMLTGTTAFTQANYAAALNGWTEAAKLPLLNGVRLTAPGKYTAATNPGRATLINNYGWLITDGGP